MANDKKITVSQLEKLARRIDDKFFDENEIEQVIANSGCKYVVTTNDDVVDVYGDGYAYQITINSDFSTYVANIYNSKAVWFDLSSVLNSTTLVSVTGFEVSVENEGYVLTGDCTLKDVWYHFTIRSTTWPS